MSDLLKLAETARSALSSDSEPGMLLDLAARCEAATGPSLELDNAIRDAAGEPRGNGKSTPYFTASIDAAMTLVPEGWRWQVESTGVAAMSSRGVQVTSPDPLHSKAPATPALALCAAALRARSEAAAVGGR